MKKIQVLLVIALPYLAQAQLETYGRYTTGGHVEPNVNYFGSKKITEKVSLTFFGLIEQKWSEALIGASYAVSKSFNVGVSAGIEQGTDQPRYSVSFWTGKGKTSLAALGELGSGKDNYLYKANLFYKSTERFTIGATAWRFHGLGPNFRWRFPKLSSTIWTMPAYDPEANISKLMVGVSVVM